MSVNARPRLRYDTRKIVRDMAAKGWMQKDLAAASGLNAQAVSRFIRGERQTGRVAKRIAFALDRVVLDYVLDDTDQVAV